MKFRTLISASLIAGALFSVTACSSTAPAPTPTQISVSASSSEEVKMEAAGYVTSSLNQYYYSVTDPESTAIVTKISESLAGKDINALTDYEREDITMQHREAFRHFDTSTAENFTNAYNKIISDTKVSTEHGVETIMVPMDSVTFTDEGKATIDASKLVVVIKGEPTPITSAPYNSPATITLTQTEYNDWVIIPTT